MIKKQGNFSTNAYITDADTDVDMGLNEDARPK